MIVGRYLAGSAFLAAAVVAAGTGRPAVLAACGVGAALAQLFVHRRGRGWLSVLPIVVFAAVLAALQLASAGRVSMLPVKTVVVFLLLSVVWRVWPFAHAIEGVQPGSRLWTLVLFALVTRHFIEILQTETVRVWRAWALRVPRRFGPLGFRSLSWTVVAIILRCWARAERFYGAQRLRGLSA
jgi:hypothetical protein